MCALEILRRKYEYKNTSRISPVRVSLTKLEDKLNHGTLRTGKVITGAKDAKDFTNRVLESVIETEIGKARVLKK